MHKFKFHSKKTTKGDNKQKTKNKKQNAINKNIKENKEPNSAKHGQYEHKKTKTLSLMNNKTTK